MEASVTLNLNNSPFAKGIEDAKKKSHEFGHVLDSVTESVKKVFADTPKMSEQGSQAVSRLTRGLVNLRGAAGGGGGPGGGGPGLLLAGLIGGVVGAAITKLPELIGRIRSEGQEAKASMHELGTEGLRLSKSVAFEQPAEGLEALGHRSRELQKNLRGVHDELRKYEPTLHPLSATLRRVYSGIAGAYEGFKTGAKVGGQSYLGALVGTAMGVLRPGEQASGQRQERERAADIFKNRQNALKAMTNMLSVTKEQIVGDRFEADIIQERFDTELKISKLRKRFTPEELAPLREASDLRIKQLRAQQALVKLDIAAEYHKSQLERPGIGLIDREVQGAELFRRRADIQRQMQLAMSPEQKGRLAVQGANVRNSIEDLEYRQWIAETRGSGGQSTGRPYGGGTQAWGERLQAQRRKQIQDMIRNNPVLKKRLDQALGEGYTQYAPGQDALLPSEVKTDQMTSRRNLGSGSPSRGELISGRAGGRTIDDLYNLIEQKWQ